MRDVLPEHQALLRAVLAKPEVQQAVSEIWREASLVGSFGPWAG